jgi:fructose-1,6-bisphosphatase I
MIMDERLSLYSHLEQWGARDGNHEAADVIAAIASTALNLSDLIAGGPLSGITGRVSGANVGGDLQKDLDIVADHMMRHALRQVPVAALVSEEADQPEILDRNAKICVAIDPLDGSANIENNMSVGTIFSIRPRGKDIISSFFEPGTAQIAAGFFVYGPQTTLALALDDGVDIFTRDPRTRDFILTRRGIRIAPETAELAINVSNRRHWNGAVRAYVDECFSVTTGERTDVNMRWIGAVVAEAFRILVRGGVFLYPADARPGYREGRLRLLYEAHPMALIMEWAGGAASDGRRRILDLSARMPHQRVPLIMGSSRAVRDIDMLHEGVEPLFESSDAPLFARRGLFR